MVANYTAVDRPADLITAFCPFVTAAPVLAWRLPFAVLAPDRLLARIRANLARGGELLMVNHGEREAVIAAAQAGGARFVRRAEYLCREPFLPRPEPAVASRWTPGPAWGT